MQRHSQEQAKQTPKWQDKQQQQQAGSENSTSPETAMTCSGAEAEVNMRAQQALVAAGSPSVHASFHLNSIWNAKDFDQTDLPAYVKTHCNVISFPEKVSCS